MKFRFLLGALAVISTQCVSSSYADVLCERKGVLKMFRGISVCKKGFQPIDFSLIANSGAVHVGPQGPQGAAGSAGTTGAQGAKGDKGDRGEKGDKGDRGLPGFNGAAGERGAPGLQGLQGLQGAKGDKGLTGEKGIKGDKGDKGDRGDKGDKGDTGAQGIAGLIGVAGPKGEKGEKGEPGVNPLGEYSLPPLSESRGDFHNCITLNLRGLCQDWNGCRVRIGVSLSDYDNTIDVREYLIHTEVWAHAGRSPGMSVVAREGGVSRQSVLGTGEKVELFGFNITDVPPPGSYSSNTLHEVRAYNYTPGWCTRVADAPDGAPGVGDDVMKITFTGLHRTGTLWGGNSLSVNVYDF